MLSDSELLKRLHDVLRTADLDTATPATVRRALEQNLGIDLSDKKPYIRQQIDLYLQSHYEEEQQQQQQIDNESENVKEKEQIVNNGGTVSEDDDDDDDDDDDEQDESDTDQNVKINSKREKTTANVKKRGGFAKPCALSPQLEKFIGEPEMARTEVVKKIWAYIKEKDLQNPKNKRKIMCDEMLHDIFRVKSIDMFQMNKVLSKHIWPIEEEDAAVKPSVKKQNKRSKDEDEPAVKPPAKKKQSKRVKEEDEPNEEGKRQKTKGSGFTLPHPISEELIQFLGTDETELSRAEAVKRMWEYIKQNDLQDPSDKRRILCDDKLKELFNVDKFVGFTVSKLLSPHFIKEKE